jgi:16S rRNA (cytidine1402-2'-O)-methyltransferase
MKQSGKIYLIPNVLAPDTAFNVISPQVLDIIIKIKYFFVEDIRTARRFISSLKLGVVIDNLTFYELNKDTSSNETRENIQIVLSGNDAGILSEAGCPGIADPGSELVKIAHQYQLEVIPLVGPSSILLALMASGLNGQSFAFNGYLPIKGEERKKSIQLLEKNSQKLNQSQIFIETPYRNQQLFTELLNSLQINTLLCIACNLTAPDQFIKTMKVKDWKSQVIDINKKPAIFILQA